MSMQAESLEILEKADVPPGQARAIVRAIEIELAGAKDVLATKHEILLLRQELRQEMSELSQQLRGEMSALSQELRGEMSVLRGDVKAEIGRLEVGIHAGASGITRQMYLALLGQMAVLLGIAYFFVTNVI